MTPIGKGSRFLVLSGDLRGREGEVYLGPVRGWYVMDLGEGLDEFVTAAELESVRFKRLPDAPTPLG